MTHVFGSANLSLGDVDFPPITVSADGPVVVMGTACEQVQLLPSMARLLARLLVNAADHVHAAYYVDEDSADIPHLKVVPTDDDGA